jgi:hypothetical protein
VCSVLGQQENRGNRGEYNEALLEPSGDHFVGVHACPRDARTMS